MQLFAILLVFAVAIGLGRVAHLLWRDAKTKVFIALEAKPPQFVAISAPRAPRRQPVRTRRTNLPMPVAA